MGINRKSLYILICLLTILIFGCQTRKINLWKNQLISGQHLVEQKKYSEAIVHLENLLKQASKLRSLEQSELLEINSELANCYNKIENYSKSVDYFNEVLKIIEDEDGKNGNSYGQALSELAIIQKKQGFYNNAMSMAKEAVEITKNAKDFNNQIYALSLTNLCQIYDEIGEYELAIPIQLEALNQFNDNEKNELKYAVGLFTLAKLYGQISNYKEAINLYTKVKQILGENHPGSTAANNNLGQIYDRIGDYEKALEFNQLALSKAEFGTAKYANRAQNVAYNYVSVGEYNKGLQYYEKAVESYKNSLGEDHKDFGKLLNNIGKLYYKINDFETAEKYFSRAISNFLLYSSEDHADYGYYLNDYANTLFELGKEEESINLMKENIEIAKRNNRTETEAFVNREFNLASTLIKTKNFSEALPILERSTNHIKNILGNHHPDYGMMLMVLSEAYFGLNKNEQAISALELSNKILIHQINEIFKFRSEAEKKAFLTTLSSVFDKTQALSYKYNLVSPELNSINLNNQLMLKGLLLNNSKNVLESLSSLNDSLIEKKISSYRYEKDKYAKVLSKEVLKRAVKIDSLNEIINKKEAELVKIYTSNFTGDSQLTKDWRAIKKNLMPDEVALEFAHFNVSENNEVVYVAYIITHTSEYPKLAILFNEKELNKSLSSRQPNQLYKLRGSIAKSTHDTKALYDIIWKPLENDLINVNKIYFSPSGLLNQIPLAALSKEKVILGEKYNLVQLSSSEVITSKLSQPDKSSTLFIGGVDYGINENIEITPNEDWEELSETLNEIITLQKLFLTNQLSYNSLTGNDASEENFKKISGRSPKVIHIATHGFFNSKAQVGRNEEILSNSSDDPLLRSGLILSGVNSVKKQDEEDGVLTALEISNLDLSNTDMVVLSACETGLGDIDGNEGVYGLQRAFKMAGVEIIVMSLWQVPDKETAEFMTLLYNEWLSLDDIRLAFNKTQKTMQKKYKNEPYKWAAFVLFE